MINQNDNNNKGEESQKEDGKNHNNNFPHHYYVPSQQFSTKFKKKTGNACYCLNLLEKYGPINLIIKPLHSKIFISKLTLVQFDDHFDELFEKGKNIQTENSNTNLLSVPDITFWYQRYYYYSKFDDGIQMDNESNFLYNN